MGRDIYVSYFDQNKQIYRTRTFESSDADRYFDNLCKANRFEEIDRNNPEHVQLLKQLFRTELAKFDVEEYEKRHAEYYAEVREKWLAEDKVFKFLDDEYKFFDSYGFQGDADNATAEQRSNAETLRFMFGASLFFVKCNNRYIAFCCDSS